MLHQIPNVKPTPSDYTVTLTETSKCAEKDNDVILTCTSSYPDTVSSAPNVEWFKTSLIDSLKNVSLDLYWLLD